ncbi:hypothetical protein HK096_000800, partial [Nowakowskiella sp. JEL0078]
MAPTTSRSQSANRENVYLGPNMGPGSLVYEKKKEWTDMKQKDQLQNKLQQAPITKVVSSSAQSSTDKLKALVSSQLNEMNQLQTEISEIETENLTTRRELATLRGSNPPADTQNKSNNFPRKSLPKDASIELLQEMNKLNFRNLAELRQRLETSKSQKAAINRELIM